MAINNSIVPIIKIIKLNLDDVNFIFENKVVEMNHKIGSDPIYLTLACRVFITYERFFT
jgi:hypothetical protein